MRTPRQVTENFVVALAKRGAEAVADVAIGEGLYLGTQYLLFKMLGMPDDQIKDLMTQDFGKVMTTIIVPFYSATMFRPVRQLKQWLALSVI